MVKPSIFTKKLLIENKADGYGILRIKRDLLKKNVNVSRQTISKICKRFFKLGRITDLHRNGRKLILQTIHLDFVNDVITNNREITTEKIANDLKIAYGIKVSKQTISRAAKRLLWVKKSTR